jgi:exodeoxyribonuclease VII large subunit
LPLALRRRVDVGRLGLSERAGSLRPALLRRLLEAEAARLADRSDRLEPGLARYVEGRREALARRADRLSARPILREIESGRSRLTELTRRLIAAEAAKRQERRQNLDALDRLRETLGYRETLRRGYAVVRGDGQVLTSRAAAEAAAGLEIEFSDGTLRIGGGARPQRGKIKPPEQGSLF